jgi:hypothetical protein
MTQQAILDLHAKIDQLADAMRLGHGALSDKIDALSTRVDALPTADRVRLMVIDGIATANLPSESRVEVLINNAQQKNEASFKTTRNWAIGLMVGVVMAAVAFGSSTGQRLATLEGRAPTKSDAASSSQTQDLQQIKSQLAAIQRSLDTKEP